MKHLLSMPTFHLQYYIYVLFSCCNNRAVAEWASDGIGSFFLIVFLKLKFDEDHNHHEQGQRIIILITRRYLIRLKFIVLKNNSNKKQQQTINNVNNTNNQHNDTNHRRMFTMHAIFIY